MKLALTDLPQNQRGPGEKIAKFEPTDKSVGVDLSGMATAQAAHYYRRKAQREAVARKWARLRELAKRRRFYRRFLGPLANV